MKVTTSAPVYVNTKEVAKADLYMNAGGKGKEKFKSFLSKAGTVGRDSGLFDYVLNKGVKGQDTTQPYQAPPQPEAPKKPFYKNPIFIGGVALVVVGAIAYFVVKSKKK